MTLKNLFIKHKSDKYSHQYYKVYEKYLDKLKKKKLNILEIGVSDGSSMKAWSEYFTNSKIIGIDIKKIDIKKNKLNKKNISIHCGSQSDKKFLHLLIKKYKKFDIIIDDGSHFPKDVIKSFRILFNSLKVNGIYFIEDTQTSYNHYFGGNAFDLKFAKTHMNFFKNLTDTINYREIANPFYLQSGYDGHIKNISFFNNMVVVQKGVNNLKSNLVLNNSYENKRYNTKVSRGGGKLLYFFKYKIFFNLYTLILFSINFLKKIILFRY
tara:strand:+ start:2582 stop:3382 length:801 start_codon:yes stop_codon:yes gene_type:complete